MRPSLVKLLLAISLVLLATPATGQDEFEAVEGPPAADEESPATDEPPAADEEPDADATAETPETEVISAAHGSMRVGAILQAGFEFLPDARAGDRNSFDLQRARLLLDGHLVSENLRYLLTGDATEGLAADRRPGAPGSEMVTDRPGADVPFLLDARITWRVPAIGVSISAGRFVPAWGLTMQSRPTRLGAIAYPLYVHGAEGSIGRFRNVGLDAQIRVVDFLAFEAGLFNGGRNTFGDDNDAKDVIAGILLEPVAGLRIRAASFFAFPTAIGATRQDGSAIAGGTETHIQPIVEARYTDFGFDVMIGGAASFVERHEADTRDDTYSMGGMAHLGYLLVGDWFQLFVRGEIWEPDVGIAEDDQLRITAGPQLFLEGIHSQIRINYLYDRFGGAAAMCRVYLGVPACSGAADVPAAKRNASTVMIQAAVDL